MIDFAVARTAMVDCQVRPSDVTRYPIIAAMQLIPREAYVPPSLQQVAYAGDHIALAPGRVVLDPRIFSKMLDALAINPDELVLDIGCGLGYSSAVIAQLAEAVVALEENPDLVAEAGDVLVAQSVDNAVLSQAALSAGDPAHGPYDAIVIEGGIEVLPDAIAAQLKDGGRVAAIFMNGASGQMCIGTKRGSAISWRTEFDATAPVLAGFADDQGFRF